MLKIFASDVARLAAGGIQLLLAHGGGPHISALLKRLGIESSFRDGLRVTDNETLAVAEMALCGAVNKAITRELLKAGANAAGVSGEDGGLLRAEIIDPGLGRVGRIIHVNPAILNALLAGGFLPVIAPLALDNECEPLNVNADTAAGAIAGVLKASFFILVSDVPGVFDKEGKLIDKLSGGQIRDLIADGVINGGMIPKVECCLAALAAGCEKALILNGKAKNSLGNFLEKGLAQGTLIEAD